MAERIVALVKSSIKLFKYANTDTEKDIQYLQYQLMQMYYFLWSFDGKDGNLGKGNELVSKTRDLAYETDDIIDLYQLNISKIQSDIVFLGLRQMVFKIRTCIEIEPLRKRIDEFQTNKKIFFTQINQTKKLLIKRLQRVPIANDEEEEEVMSLGFDRDEEAIISRLTNDEPELQMISIVGMGGVGKTTLARMVYNHNHVLKHFNFRAWAHVSRDYNVAELLQAIIKCDGGGVMIFADETKGTNDVDLMMMFRKYLGSKRYLIVLDDVWETQALDDLNEIFAKNLNGSRIIITTRNERVASHANKANPSNVPHHLYSLDRKGSWALFSKKVFQGRCPPYFEEVGKNIVEKCKGLPLAINLIAGVLRGKDSTDDWYQILSSVKLFGIDYKQFCMDILTLSYDDLPYRLKMCFLYFAIFPEDFEVRTRQLIRLWVAEGLAKQDGEPTEVNAEKYLEELIDRNLIKVTKTRFNGSVKACRIQGLTREFCILKAKEEKFVEVYVNVNSSSPANSRRLAIHSNAVNYISSNSSPSNARSFLFFGGLGEDHLSSKHWKSLYKGFPLIRVLDLFGVSVDSIPSELDKLIHLRYLRLTSHTARSIPSSICNLQNLQILEVRAPLIDRLHIEIWNMEQLRHLIFRGQVVLPETWDHDDALSNLKTLLSLSPDSCTKHNLLRLPNLVKLGIRGDLKAHMDGKAFRSVAVLKELQTLKLERDRRCQSLSSLDLVEFPENITKLTLSEIQLSSDPMQKLGQLPNLQVLKLTNGAYVGDVLDCCSGGFPQLKVLKLINLRVKKWDFFSGSLVSLQSLVISRCSNLQGLPSALRNMSTLRELEIWWPNPSVLRDARDLEGHTGRNRLKLTIYHSEEQERTQTGLLVPYGPTTRRKERKQI